MTLTRSNVAPRRLGRCPGPSYCGRVGVGDRWAGEGRARAASPAVDGRRERSQVFRVPDSDLLCASRLCPGCSHFTRARGLGCNLSRTLILHIPRFSGGRGEEDKEGKGPFCSESKASERTGGKEEGYRSHSAQNALGPG